MRKRVVTARAVIIACSVFIVSTLLSLFSSAQLSIVTTSLTTGGVTPPATKTAVASGVSSTSLPLPSPTPTPLPAGFTGGLTKIALIEDTFHRPDQQSWGYSTNNAQWEEDGRFSPAFSIKNNQGIIAGQGKTYITSYHTAITYDVEITATVSVNALPDNSLGLLLRYQDRDNWYGARCDGQRLVLEKRVNGVTTPISIVAFPMDVKQLYVIRVLMIKKYIAVKIWPQNQRQPGLWSIFARDTTFEKGYGGVYATLHANAQASLVSFISSGVWVYS